MERKVIEGFAEEINNIFVRILYLGNVLGMVCNEVIAG